jgi:hypothetical protein
MHTKESLELLKKMSQDAGEGVRNQAVEYLESRREKSGAGKK